MSLRIFLPLAVGAALVAPAAASADFPHTVVPGESLSSVAATDGLSIGQLAAANGLTPNGLLISGSTLRLSGGGTMGTLASSSAATSQPVGTAANGTPGGPPYPTPERVSTSEVGHIASANGVSPSLAEAI